MKIMLIQIVKVIINIISIGCNHSCLTCTGIPDCSQCKITETFRLDYIPLCLCQPGYFDEGVSVCSSNY